MSGYYLSDSNDKITKWRFPDGTTIGTYGYLIVWADKDTLQEGLHANFKLSAEGEEVLLVSPDKVIVDHVIYNEQNVENLAYARNVNGTGMFVWQQPTFKSNNGPVTSLAKNVVLNRKLN